MNISKIVPNTIRRGCMICLDDTIETSPHNCRHCDQRAWSACDICTTKLITCPICRVPLNPLNPNNRVDNSFTININLNTIGHPTRTTINNSSITERVSLSIGYICSIPIVTIILMYLGKIYIYMYCSGTCDLKKYPGGDGCDCYTFSNRDNYWGDFKKFPNEFLIGLIVTAILLGCCVSGNQ